MRRLTGVAMALGSLTLATIVTWALITWTDIGNASSVYLLAVAAVALTSGVVPAVATAVGAFVLYNFLFVEPRFSLAVAEPQSVLTLLLLLAVGVLVGRLTSIGRDRASAAARREREARAMFAMTRGLASSSPTEEALRGVVERLVVEGEIHRAWIALGPTVARERLAVDSHPSMPTPVSSRVTELQRTPGEADARWLRIHAPSAGRRTGSGAGEIMRVKIEAGEETFGSLYAQTRERAGDPPLETARLLAVAADQVGQALRRDRLARRAMDVEIAERSDAAKSALLDLVSHELRTPLATIRASAGNLADPSIELTAAERQALAEAIDMQALHLNRLLGNLLDMTRLQSGRIAPDIEVIPLHDAIETVIKRLQPSLEGRAIETSLADDVAPVLADAVYLDQVVTNLLENAARYSAPEAIIRISASSMDDHVEIKVEDGGPGVADGEIGRIFERFYRGAGGRPHPGTGLGLAVVRGLVETMGGSVSAGRSELGGLSVLVRLPAARPLP